MQRNFECPETEEPCQDGRCTKTLCCERERFNAATTRETADKHQRIQNAEVWETIAPILQQVRSKRP